MIEVKSLKKTYGNKDALRGISFDIKQGEIFGLLGPNGAGKSTTLKILTGQLLPSYGEAKILGMDTIKERNKLYSNIGVVPENANLYERLSILQNLEFFCRLYNCSPSSIDSYLEQVRLTVDKHTQVKKLSKGMKQKVLLIRALLHNPKVLFLDEPTSGLDPTSADEIHKILRKLNGEGMTIMLTSHNMEEVDKLCNRVAFLNDGKLAEVGLPEELKLKYAEKNVRVLVQENGKPEEKVLSIFGEQSAALISGWIRDGKIRSIHSCEPTLADIFMKVTGRDLK
ncbi:MAG: ABC transporter ATP-binding protein [Clostridia bacterium]|nr:ABC transporter ATP-binding protein [Clostridia bacterium]